MTQPKPAITKDMLVNALTRQLSTIMPGFYGGDTKRPYFYRDYGYPENLVFDNYMMMYKRNGIAAAGVNRAIETCWQSYPVLQEKQDTHDQTTLEKQITDAFDRLNFWSNLSEADRFSRIGRYAGVIFRFKDNLQFDQPVNKVGGGLDGLAEVIAVNEGQLTVSELFSDPQDTDNYGKVKMYQFTEQEVTDGKDTIKMRQFMVHPDRVHIWSKNMTIWNDPILESGYNDLLTIQKINGAGGEGFWKNAKAAPILNIEKDAQLQQLARMLGITNGDLTELGTKLDEIVDDYNKGLDATMTLQGIDAKLMSVSLPSPEHFLMGPTQSFSASISIPLKILLGSQTGERASTEDAKEWNKTCNSRRENYIKPNVISILRRFEKYGIIPARPWYLLWGDLTESSSQEKADLGAKMADVNAKMRGNGENDVFDANEIREVMGWEARVAEKVEPRPKGAPADDEATD
jgi:hypothetical protein